MANDPNNLADIIDVQANFIPPTSTGTFGFSNPLKVAEFTANASFPGRVKGYKGTLAQKQTLMLNDGFATTSATYRQVTAAGIQKGPPRTIYVGRKEPGGAETWPEALDAIKAEAITKKIGYYAICCDTRDVFDIEDIDAWTVGQFALYVAQTDSLSVRNNTPGNVAELILAKDHSRSALLWHDPAAASKFGPAVLTSIPGTYSVVSGDTLKFRVDGGAEQTFTFVALAATVLGGTAETYDVSNGDAFDFAIDSGSTQSIVFVTGSATLINVSPETYNILDGDTLNIRIDGGGVQVVEFNGLPGTITSSNSEPYVPVNLEHIDIAIDGGLTQVFTFDGSETSAQLVADLINLTASGFTAADVAGDIVFTTATKGTASEVEIVGTSTAALLTNLGFVAGSTFGSGFAPNIALATAAQVATEINNDTVDLTASDVGGQVQIVSNAVGTGSRVQVSGGTANGVLDFDTNEVKGPGDFVDASLATASEVVTKLAAAAAGVVAEVETAMVRLTSRRIGSGSKIEVFASTMATKLGFAFVATLGSGDFFDTTVASASEIQTKISATVVSATVSVVSSAVVLTSGTSGPTSELEITGGTLISTLFFTNASGVANKARGVGTDEDYADCAWVGRCITFKLDSATTAPGGGGAGVWDNHTLVGVFADTDITDIERAVIHDTLQVNTYENRNGRDETHFGTLLNNTLGAGRYIDVRTSLDWLKARAVEGLKRILDEKADIKGKVGYTDVDAATFDNFLRSLLQKSAANGHTVFDDSALDLDDPLDTGIFMPLVAGQTTEDISNRLFADMRIRQTIVGAIQRAKATIELIGPQGL